MSSQATSAKDSETPKSVPVGVDISALSASSDSVSSDRIGLQEATLVGHYHLLRRIGTGGMGEVWLVEQMHPVRRQVALKLIKAGMDTAEVVARFQSERQALALMDHPTIAKVLDAGSTPHGRPYFVMEYIAGVPITQYCGERKLTIRDRLELFIQVCEGVQHAHQKAIIHRDLKPSNILVSEVDGKPLARIIDFGVAKAIAQGVLAGTQCTQAGAIIGTSEYMSPEQADPTDVDTRTDVYSLGVVLFELLVGKRPIEFEGLTLTEKLRRLREQEPPRPSTKVRTVSGDYSDAGRNRSSNSLMLARELRGDLDAIILKTLEKDRSRRYGSPSDLALDIRRYLGNDPVLAVTPSKVYYARKFARRYRAAFLTSSAFVLVLSAATIVSLRQSIRANSEAALAQAVTNFLQNDVLTQANSYQQWVRFGQIDPDLKVRTALDRAAERLTGKFKNDPQTEAAIRKTIAGTYLTLGRGKEAQEQYELELDLERRVLGKENPQTLRTLSSLADAFTNQGKYAEGAKLFEEALALELRTLGPRHPDVLNSMITLAGTYREQGKFPQSESLYVQILATSREVFGPEHEFTLSCMDRLAEVFYKEGKYWNAEVIGTRVLEMRLRRLGPEHPETTVSMSDLGNVYRALGKFSRAEELHSQVLDIRRRVLGPAHPYVMAGMNSLARSYSHLGKTTQAEALDARALELRRRVLGPEHPETLMSMDNLAADYADEGKYSMAEGLFGQTLEIQRRLMGNQSRFTLATLSDSVFMYQRESKYSLAAKNAAEVLEARQHSLGPESAITLEAATDLLTARLSDGQFAESEPLARETVARYRKNHPNDWQGFRAESLLGASLGGQKRYAEAESTLLEGYQGMVERKSGIPAPKLYYISLARGWIVNLYRSWGKPEKGE